MRRTWTTRRLTYIWLDWRRAENWRERHHLAMIFEAF
jgi:hypothetical protein